MWRASLEDIPLVSGDTGFSCAVRVLINLVPWENAALVAHLKHGGTIVALKM